VICLSCSVSNLQLFTQENSRSIAIKAIAKAHKLELNIVHANLGNPSPEHLEVNRLGKIPTFIGEGGFVLSECIAVALYCMSTIGLVHSLAPC
jgi:elongation factor 1-gamma